VSGVLGVHGIKNWADTVPAEAARAKADQWAHALEVPSMTFAYYAHHLQLVKQGTSDDLEQLDRQFNGVPAALLTKWLEALNGQPVSAGQGHLGAPIRQLAAGLVARFGGDRQAAHRFIARYLTEVSTYLDPRLLPRRQAVRAEVANAISTHRPRIVIAHSLGSVVTYETLWHNPTLSIDLLISLGSPLGLPGQIFPKLDPAPRHGKDRKPPNVTRWINIADPGDPVAIPKHLAQHFDGLDQDLDVIAGFGVTHRAAGYLATGLVRRLVTDALRR